MGFLRRLLGGGSAPADVAQDPSAADQVDLDADERRHEAEMLAAEQARLDDFLRRQEKYADRSWVPPAQGGERRADDVPGEDKG